MAIYFDMNEPQESGLDYNDKEERSMNDMRNMPALKETRRHDEAITAAYRCADEAENAWLDYRMALPKPERDALREDKNKYRTLSRLFFGTRSAEKLRQYMTMTVDELCELADGMNAGQKRQET